MCPRDTDQRYKTKNGESRFAVKMEKKWVYYYSLLLTAAGRPPPSSTARLLTRGIRRIDSRRSWDGSGPESDTHPFDLRCRAVEIEDGHLGVRFIVREHDSAYFQRVRRAVGLPDSVFFASLARGTFEEFASNSQGSRNRAVDFFWSSDKRFMVSGHRARNSRILFNESIEFHFLASRIYSYHL